MTGITGRASNTKAGSIEQNGPGLALGKHLFLAHHIAQQIAAAHGGRISVESAPGQGATFTLALPTYEP